MSWKIWTAVCQLLTFMLCVVIAVQTSRSTIQRTRSRHHEIQLGGLGERCKRSPSRNRIWCILALKCWHMATVSPFPLSWYYLGERRSPKNIWDNGIPRVPPRLHHLWGDHQRVLEESVRKTFYGTCRAKNHAFGDAKSTINHVFVSQLEFCIKHHCTQISKFYGN